MTREEVLKSMVDGARLHVEHTPSGPEYWLDYCRCVPTDVAEQVIKAKGVVGWDSMLDNTYQTYTYRGGGK